MNKTGNRMESPSRVPRVLGITGVPIAIALVVVILVFQAMSPVFLRPATMSDYLINGIPILLITAGVAFVMVAGGIDLSIGTVAGLSAGTTIWAAGAGLPTVAVVLVGVATGLLFGVINGLVITWLGINDFIVTLATLNVAGGLLIVLSENAELRGVKAPGLRSLVFGEILGISTAFWIAGAIFFLMHLLMVRTIFGRRLFAAGVSPEAARLAGVEVGRIRFYTFVISGVLAGAAGVLLASRLGAVQAFLGMGYEFTAIAGAVLGGVSLAGGRGSVWAAVVGGLMLITLQQGLRLNGVDPVYFSIVTGLAIVTGVVFDRKMQMLGLRRGSGGGAPTDDEPRPSTGPSTRNAGVEA